MREADDYFKSGDYQGQGRTVPISCKNKAGSRLQGYGYNDRTGDIAYGSPEFCQGLVDTMRGNGVYVITKEEVEEHFAVLDDELVWYGGMNLLGKEDVWDNLMRILSVQIAAELLEIALKEE